MKETRTFKLILCSIKIHYYQGLSSPPKKEDLIRNDKMIVFIATISLIFNMTSIENRNLLNLEEFKVLKEKLLGVGFSRAGM